MRWWNTLPVFQLILTTLLPCCMLQNHSSFDCQLQNIRPKFPNSKMSKIYNKNIDLFIFEHVQFSESEISLNRKHRTYNFCNRKCWKIGKYAFLTLQNANKLNMYFSSNVIYSNVSTDWKSGKKMRQMLFWFPHSKIENQNNTLARKYGSFFI